MTAHPSVDIPAALRHLRRTGPPMRALIRRHGPPELSRTRDSFASLGRAIIYQQLSGKAAGTIYRRFLELFGSKRFPRPDVILGAGAEHLRSAGLSRAKAAYLIDLSTHFKSGAIASGRFSRMDNDAIARALTQVKGIGPWSVDMFLMFGLCRPDVLPVGDLGIRKGMQKFFEFKELPNPAQMERAAEAWRPYRTVGSWYMWRVLEEE